jgi:hypothetical protein
MIALIHRPKGKRMLIDPKLFILIHVLLSVIGIVAGLVVVGGLMAGVRFSRWIDLFLFSTVLTSITGYGFPSVEILPAHIIGAISLVALAGAIAALYWKRLSGGWRQAFVILSVLALYLNVFVLLAQLFQKIPAITVLVSTSTSPVFGLTQGLVLALFIGLGWATTKRSNAAKGA